MNRSVVVMDNCSTHHDEEIRQIIEDECGKCFVSHQTIDIADPFMPRCEAYLPPAILARPQSNRGDIFIHEGMVAMT